MYIFGMRASELCNLTNDDINLSKKYIFIKGLKNGLKHTYNLDEKICAYLEDYINSRKDPYNLQDPNLPFFLRERTYNKLHRNEIARIYKKYAILARIKPELMHPHTLRHTCACHLAIDGKQPHEVQKTLRHKSITNTMIYFQLVGKDLDNVLNSNSSSLVKNI
jgi:type 1 fimbriae regulatory protein FimB